MNYYLGVAAVLAALVGAAHSLLGEKFVLGPLFQRGHLPKLMGSAEFTGQVLRFTWHVTTALLWGLAAILWLLSRGSPGGIGAVVAWTFVICSAIALLGTRGKHFSWFMFLAIAVMVWFGSGFAFGQQVTVVLVGDSTVNDGGGWGPGFRASFGPEFKVINLALNGRSSKSFRDEGAWQPALEAEADYILIQFGHNDCPGKGPHRETDPETTYRANMIRYLEEAQAAGAKPVLVTSIVRRVFTPDGKIKPDCLAPFADQVRKLASELDVGLIDLYALTLVQSERLGPDGSATLGTRNAEGKLDTTHLGRRGQREIGAMAARELVKLEPRLKKWVSAPARRR